jgi:hypothetical protein
MLKWTIINKTYCVSQSIWNKQLNIKDDKTKTLGKSRFGNWQLDWLNVDKANLIDWKKRRGFLMTMYEIGRDISACWELDRYVHICWTILTHCLLSSRISSNNNNNSINVILLSDVISRQSIWTIVHINIEMTAV